MKIAVDALQDVFEREMQISERVTRPWAIPTSAGSSQY